jgi:hypothetical protein
LDIAQVEGALLEKLKDDPEKLLRNPAILRQLKQTAGVLADDQPPQTFINLGQVQAFMQQRIESKQQERTPEMVVTDSGGGMSTITVEPKQED